MTDRLGGSAAQETVNRGFVPCDRCGHRSQSFWTMDDGRLTLTFCGHHGRLLEAQLIGLGWEEMP